MAWLSLYLSNILDYILSIDVFGTVLNKIILLEFSLVYFLIIKILFLGLHFSLPQRLNFLDSKGFQLLFVMILWMKLSISNRTLIYGLWSLAFFPTHVCKIWVAIVVDYLLQVWVSYISIYLIVSLYLWYYWILCFVELFWNFVHPS